MVKIVKRALSVCLIVVLASGLSMLTTAYVVNTYIQSVLASFDIKLDGPGPGIGGFVKSLTGMGGSGGPPRKIPKRPQARLKAPPRRLMRARRTGRRRMAAAGNPGIIKRKRWTRRCRTTRCL